MTNHLFISYARSDGETFAKTLDEQLRARDLNSWFDRSDIRTGYEWDRTIDEAITTCWALLFVMTPGSIESSNCHDEWSRALSLKKSVLPLLFRPVSPPMRLHRLQYIDFTHSISQGTTQLFSHLLWMRSPEGELQALRDRLDDLKQLLQQSSRPGAVKQQIQDLQKQITYKEQTLKNLGTMDAESLQAAKSATDAQLTALVKSRRTERKVSRQHIVGSAPQGINELFKDRQQEEATISNLLLAADSDTRAISLYGRGGIGKTALACKIMQGFEGRSQDVHGLMYLSMPSPGISLERIYLDSARMLGGTAEKRLKDLWTNVQMDIPTKIQTLIECYNKHRCLLLLDNVESLLDKNGHLLDPNLRLFLETFLRQQHKARLLITSREPIALADDARRYEKAVLMEEGLPVEDASALLKALDPDRSLGLADAEQGVLEEAVAKTYGYPRALEALVGILAQDPFMSLTSLLENEALFGDTVIEKLVREAQSRLDTDATRVMQALALYGRPVTEAAISYLLEPFTVGLNVGETLRHLARGRYISVKRNTGELFLHPLDKEYSYKHIPTDESLPYNLKSLERRAASYYARLRPPPDAWNTLADLEPQLAEFEHWTKAGDLEEAVGVIQRSKAALFALGLYDQLSQMLQATESKMHELIRGHIGQKRVIVFLGTGDLAMNTLRDIHSEEVITVAIDKVTLGWIDANFPILAGGEGLRDTSRVISLLQSLIPADIRELPFPPILLTYYSGFDSEAVFQAAAQLGYTVFPNEHAALMTTNKLKFWEQVKDAPAIQPYLLPRQALFLPAPVVSLVRSGTRSAAVDDFLEQMLLTIQAVGLPCAIKPIITELAYGQCVVLDDSRDTLWEALRFVIKETDDRKTNPGDGFLLEKAVEKPFIELTQTVIRYRNTDGQLATTCPAPILAERRDRVDIGDVAPGLIRGPFLFYSAFYTDRQEDWPEPVQRHQELLKQISIKIVELSGGDIGVYGVGLFLRDDQIWIGDHFVIKPEDKMLVTKATHKLNAFRLLATIIEDTQLTEAEILEASKIGGARTILWKQNYEAELKAIEGVDAARRVPSISFIQAYSEKKQMWPLRIMGLILAEAPNDTPLDQVRGALDKAEALIHIVPKQPQE